MVQVTLKHLLVPNGYIPGMSLIYPICISVHLYIQARCILLSNVKQASDLWADEVFVLYNVVCLIFGKCTENILTMVFGKRGNMQQKAKFTKLHIAKEKIR